MRELSQKPSAIKRRKQIARFRAEHRCHACGKAQAPGYVLCPHCRVKRQEFNKTYVRPPSYNPEQKCRLPIYQKLYKQRLKKEVFEAYGNKCVCCGETNLAFLTIDHIYNDGAAHRAAGVRSGTQTYMWLKRNKYPNAFRILCYNCNCGRQNNGGICPHQMEIVKADIPTTSRM